MSKNKLSIIIGIVLLTLVGGVAVFLYGNQEKQSSGTLEIKHELGTTMVTKNPQSVAVFDYGQLDTLDLMGAKIVGLPKAGIPEYLSKYKDEKYVDLGSLKEPNLEKTFEVKPDLIIISGRMVDFYESLSEIAPTIYLPVNDNDYLLSLETNANILADIFNEQELVTKEITSIKDSLKELDNFVKKEDFNALITLSNNGDISAYGEVSRFGIIHKNMGFKSVGVDESTTHGNTITFEYILKANPDFIFVVDRSAVAGGDISAKKSFDNEIIKSTDAFKNDRIIYLDSVLWYTSTGGINGTKMMIESIKSALE